MLSGKKEMKGDNYMAKQLFEVDWQEYTFDIWEKVEESSPSRQKVISGEIRINPRGIPLKERELGFGFGRLFYEVNPQTGIGRIKDVFLTPNIRGKGIGGKVVKLAESRVCCFGGQKIGGSAASEVHKFWEHIGYKHLGQNEIEKVLESCPVFLPE